MATRDFHLGGILSLHGTPEWLSGLENLTRAFTGIGSVGMSKFLIFSLYL